MKRSTFILLLSCIFSLLLLITACGGGAFTETSGNSAPSSSTATYAVGGSVQGLVGIGLVLEDNLGDNLQVTANGSFTFSKSISGGSSYDVTVLTQPTSPAQTCSLTDAMGTANSNVTTVRVVCANDSPVGQWTWVGGSDLPRQLGTYGTLLTPSAANAPGARYNAVSWNDAAGNFWLFGGSGFGSKLPGLGDLNDLWKYSAGQWTWMSGSNLTGLTGVYGTQGVAAPDNTPGGMKSSVSWVDAAGNFWLFGGSGPDSTGTESFLNQLWEYSHGKWIWVSGSKLGNQPATYGTKGTASTDNVPSSRAGAVEWTDAAGDFWIFGGFGVSSSSEIGDLNDLWKYSAGEWTWMGGSKLTQQAGVYGTQGQPASTNMPGTRNSAMGWVDADGNFWLFGGAGSDSKGTDGDLSDMWEYSNGQWTWVGGSDLQGEPGSYGTRGVAASTNLPGARNSSLALTDASGNFWLFGGTGLATTTVKGDLNDIWKFSAGQWTWIGGSKTLNEAGIYGVLGTSSPEDIPGGRTGPVGRVDAAGGIWIFGGTLGLSTPFNDLWMYQP